MIKDKFYRIVEQICPSELAESWDNSGLQLNSKYSDVNRVLVALEINDEVIDEALAENADMIVTHHPLLFRGVTCIDDNTAEGRYINRLIRGGISVYSCHTSFDIMEGGNNDYLGNVLGLAEIEAFEDEPICRKGITPLEIRLLDFVHRASQALEMSERHFRIIGDPERSICTVGWCTGAGAEYIAKAAAEGCDLFITGDVKYHDAQMAKAMDICVLDAGHYGTEKIFIDNMAELLSRKTNCVIIKSKIDINPFL